MSFNLTLNSTNVIQNTNNSQYSFKFPLGAIDVYDEATIQLSSLTIPYSMQNVNSYYGNNGFSYYAPSCASGQTLYNINLPNGFYTINDLNNALQSTLKTNGHYWYNTNPIFLQGTISGTTLTLTSILTNTTVLPIGSVIVGYNVTINSVIVSQLSATTYQLSLSSTVSAATAMSCSNNNEINSQIIYPLTLSTSAVIYSNLITSIVVPLSSNVNSVLGLGWAIPSLVDGQASWSGVYPTYAGSCFQLVIPTTTQYSTTLGNILGFIGGSYPSIYTGYTDPTKQIIISSNSLSQLPPYAPQGSFVDAIIIRCNLVENTINVPGDILQTIPITSTYGNNINFISPDSNAVCKMRKGRYNSINITIVDQNYNSLICLDSNVLISLLIKNNKI